MKRFTKILFTTVLTLAMVSFVGQFAPAGPGCGAAKDTGKGCDVKTCAAKSSCTTIQKASAQETQPCCKDGHKCTKEECIKRCLEIS